MARPRTPSHLKLISGTERSHKKNAKPNLAEPKPPVGVGPAPKHLSKLAKTAWHRIGAILESIGVATQADVLALESIANVYADGLDARASLFRDMKATSATGEEINVARAGETTYLTAGKSGFVLRSRPEMTIISDSDRRFLSWLSQFGLTPAARSKVQVQLVSADDPLSSYFG